MTIKGRLVFENFTEGEETEFVFESNISDAQASELVEEVKFLGELSSKTAQAFDAIGIQFERFSFDVRVSPVTSDLKRIVNDAITSVANGLDEVVIELPVQFLNAEQVYNRHAVLQSISLASFEELMSTATVSFVVYKD